MRHVELEKAISKEIKNLSESSQEEVLAFLRFLKRKNPCRIRKLSHTDSITAFLKEADSKQAHHLEDEFVNYKKLYPIEK